MADWQCSRPPARHAVLLWPVGAVYGHKSARRGNANTIYVYECTGGFTRRRTREV
jgi:hypothetical protein